MGCETSFTLVEGVCGGVELANLGSTPGHLSYRFSKRLASNSKQTGGGPSVGLAAIVGAEVAVALGQL